MSHSVAEDRHILATNILALFPKARRRQKNDWQEKRWRMLGDKIEVTDWLVDLIEKYPQSIQNLSDGSFEKYFIRRT